MRRAFQLTALVLLAVWLPATVHCGLEVIAGALAENCCHAEDSDPAAPVDHCAVEDGNYRTTSPESLVVAPEALTCWCGHVVQVVPPTEAPGAHDAAQAPPGLIRIWQFVARAALPANAPPYIS